MADLEDTLAPIDDVGDDVRAAFEQHKDLADKLITGDDVDTAQQKADKSRNERGQFVAKDTAVEQTNVAPETKITDADQPTEQLVEHSRAPEPPRGWSADEKAMWSTLPPAIQAAVSRRENEAAEGGRQWSEQRQQYERVLSPVAELSQQNGLSVQDGLNRLLTVEKRLRDDGPTMIAELAQAYGVDLASLVNGTQQPQPRVAPSFDPNQIMQMVDQRLSQAEEKRQQDAQLNSTITGFANEKDAAGKLAHEHFNAVKVLMGNLLQSGQATDMQDAYDKAVWATPTTREKLLQSQTGQQINVNRAQVDKARKAAVSKRGSPTAQVNGKAKGDFDTVEDAVRDAWNSVRGDA